MRLSGNHVGWLTNVAREIMDGGAKPPSIDALLGRVSLWALGTAKNDGHVTAGVNGLDRDDYKAGWRIWVEESVKALRGAGLVDGPDSALRWTAPLDGVWKVTLGPAKNIAVYGQAERRASRDAYRVEQLAGSEQHPLTVKVETRSHGKTYINDVLLEAHPLSLVVPAMSRNEQAALREDIQASGVHTPIVTFGKRREDGGPRNVRRILDGRHRAYFASVTGQPVVLEEFKGTEAEAKALVVSLNLHRRHMTAAQVGLTIAKIYGREAKAEAKANREATQGRPAKLPSDPPAVSNGKEAHEIAWEKAGGKATGVSPAAVKAGMTVVDAPKTAARLESGEIRSAAKAVREATAETTGRPVSTEVGAAVSDEMSAAEYIGKALYSVRRAAQVYDVRFSRATPGELDLRLDELVYQAQELRRVIAARAA